MASNINNGYPYLTFQPTEIVSVTGVSLNKSSTTLGVGDTKTLIATVVPSDATNKAVTWTSNDETVATVDENGRVTAIAARTAIIMVTTADGGKNAKCVGTVTPNVLDVPAVIVENARGKAGQTVDVVISVANNPSIAVIVFDVDYDSAAMTLKFAPLGDIFTGELDCNLDKAPFTFNVYTVEGDKTASGTLVTLKFKLNPDCAEGDYDITLSSIESANIDEMLVDFTSVNGRMTVTNFIPGDVNGDGKVTRSDLLRLAKYFSDYGVKLGK